jgi:uncharacterized protein
MGEKVVIDTNVIISAFGFGGKPRILLSKVLAGQYQLQISWKQWFEICRVLDYPKFKFTESQKEDIKFLLLSHAVFLDTHSKLNVIRDDPSDNVLLECAVESGAKAIISGDKHLLGLGNFKGIEIIDTNQFIIRKI